MRRPKIRLLIVIAFNVLLVMSHSAFSESGKPSRTFSQAATLEEIIAAGNKAIKEGDWAKAEPHFREAIRLEPMQGLWRVQLLFVLCQQKKWKEAWAEVEIIMQRGDVSWVLVINQKMKDGNVAFINTEVFGDEQKGITRYVKAVKEKKKTDSIAADIGKKLDAFARQNKIALIYDISKLKDPRFESGNTTDVTSDFIAYYNGL
jgi:hypothetical protein